MVGVITTWATYYRLTVLERLRTSGVGSVGAHSIPTVLETLGASYPSCYRKQNSHLVHVLYNLYCVLFIFIAKYNLTKYGNNFHWLYFVSTEFKMAGLKLAYFPII